MQQATPLPLMSRQGHAGHVKRCLSGLPSSQVDLDPSKLAVGFYCIGSLDLLGLLQSKTSEFDRESWREWIWEQYTHNEHGSGFKPGPFMTVQYPESDHGGPHIIMTYTALLSLAILRDDFSRLNRAGLVSFIRSCQKADGSFSTTTRGVETDLRTLYCAFSISCMLNDWSGMDMAKALAFVESCRTYEGGYGQSPYCEAHGGTTYIAIAAIHMAPGEHVRLSPFQRKSTIRWLLQNQHPDGGFCGRTGKESDACYCFWCAASLEILGVKDLLDVTALKTFLSSCQFKFGGICKAPGDLPDPYHTYLSLAALSIYPLDASSNLHDPSWSFDPLDPVINARKDTSNWARTYIPDPSSRQE